MTARARPWLAGAVAALVSFAASWVPSYWSDEVATVRASTLSPSALVRFTTTQTDAVQTLFYLVMHGWVALFGTSEAATRGFSALGIGVAAALTVRIADAVGRPRLGLAAAVLFALMPRVTEAGEEARSYAWTAALAAALWLLLLAAMKRRRWWWWAALGAVAALSTTLFLLSATLAAAQLVFVALRQRRSLGPLLVAWACAILAASPVMYFAEHERAQVAWLDAFGALNPWTVLVEPWAETSWGFGLAASALLIAAAVRWRTALAQACPEYLLLAACWVVVPLILLVATTLTPSPLFTPRYLTFATPGFALLLAGAVAALGTRRRAVVAMLALIAVALPTYVGQRGPYGKNGGSDLRQIADIVQEHARPGDAIVFEPSPVRKSLNPRLALYAYPQKFAALRDIALKTPFPHSGTLHDHVLPLRYRTEKLGVRAVWVVVPGAGASCTAGEDERVLTSARFALVARYPAHRNTVCEFTRR